MTRVCTICTHEDVRAINRALVSRVAYRDIARQYGVSKDAARRHSKEHLPELLAKAHRAQEVADADDLLGRLEKWVARTETVIDKAEEKEKFGQFFFGVATLRGYLETIGEITRELERRPQVNILIAPQVQQAIIQALEPYPEARLSVDNALSELEAMHDGS